MMLTKAVNAIEAARKMIELGPKAVVIKRGEYGFLMFTQEQGFFVLPAFPLEKVVDPTGAGDTFAGGFFGHLASLGRKPTAADLKTACIRGTILASFTIQDFSVESLAKVTPAQLETRQAAYQKVISL
jgi:sugar/nucleoside kinase (ribokinase family)